MTIFTDLQRRTLKTAQRKDEDRSTDKERSESLSKFQRKREGFYNVPASS